MRLSDMIAEFIRDEIESKGNAQIGRNELAAYFNVVPSQINYVIASRFTPEQGFSVSSKRGSGGYITITKIKMTEKNYLMHIINSIGGAIDYKTAEIFLYNMRQADIIDEVTRKIILAAMADINYGNIHITQRNAIRANIFKNMLINLAIR